MPLEGAKMRAQAVAAMVLGVMLAVVLALRAIGPASRIAVMGQEAVYDDVGFAAVASRRARTLGIGAERRTARGSYLVVRLRVHNHQRRTAYHFDPAIVELADHGRAPFADEPASSAGPVDPDDPRVYRLSPGGQRALLSTRKGPDPCADELPPDASCETELVYDIPEAARGPMLRISRGSPLSMLLGQVIYGYKAIQLP